MSNSIIISRFNEDLDWLKPYCDFKIIIYNKGEKITSQRFRNIINIKNVGRESHTWLYHIVNNYYELDEVNIFLQGRTEDLDCMAFKNPNEYIKKIKKYGFAVSRFGILGPLHWKWNVGIEKDKRYAKQWENKEISKSAIGFRKFAKKLFPDIPLLTSTSYGGCFAVTKKLIHRHDINFYSNLLEIMSSHKNPIEGHFMERLWCYMFIKNNSFTEAIFDVLYTKIERLKLNLILKYFYKNIS